MSSTRKGVTGPTTGPAAARGGGEGVLLSGGEARAVALEVDEALQTQVLPALPTQQPNNANNKNNGGWTHALTKGRIKVEVKQSTQGPSMLRATTTVSPSSTTPQDCLAMLRGVMHSPAHVCSVLQCLFPDIEAAKIAAKVVEEEVGGSSLRGGLTRSSSRPINNTNTNGNGTSSVLRVTWAPRKQRAQELLLGQRTSRVTVGEQGQAVDCHVIAPITHTERVPSLCVGSSVEAGPVLAMVVTQHATLQGAIDITLIAQGVSSLLLNEPKRILVAAGSLVWLLCELPVCQRVLLPYVSPSAVWPVLSFMSPRATRHRTLLCLPNDNNNSTQSGGGVSWRHVSVRFMCPSSGTLTITGLAQEDQQTLTALQSPPLPLVTRFKPQQVVEVQLLASSLTKDLTLTWSGLSSGVGVPVYSMDVRGLGPGPERGLCLLHNLRMLHNKTPLTSPRSPTPNANTPPSVSVVGRVGHVESWLLWFRLQLPGVKHLSLAPGPYALVETLCAPVAGWELLWDMTWPILLTPASLFALLYCVHEDVSGVCVWLLEHERLSLAGLGAVLLVVHVLSTLTLHLALSTHFRRLRACVGLEWAVVGERLGTRLIVGLHVIVGIACVAVLTLLASLLALAPIEPTQEVAQQPLPLLRGAATVILMYSGVSEAAHSKLLLVTLEYVTLLGLGALVALVHLASDGSRALGLKLVLALTDLGLLKHKTMPPVTFTGSIKESGLALLEVQEGVGSGSTGAPSKASSRRSLTPASEEHIKKLVADAIEKMKESDPEGVKRVSQSLASPLAASNTAPVLPPPSPTPVVPPSGPQSSSSLRRLLYKSRSSSSTSSPPAPVDPLASTAPVLAPVPKPVPPSPKALPSVVKAPSPQPSNAIPSPKAASAPPLPSPKAPPSAPLVPPPEAPSAPADVSSPPVSVSTPEAIYNNNMQRGPSSRSSSVGGGGVLGEAEAFGEAMSPDGRVMERPKADQPMTMAGTVWQERLTGGVLTGGRYKVWKELWLCVEGERIKLFKRRDEGEAKKAVIHYDWPIDKVHVAEVSNDPKAFRVIWPMVSNGLVSSPGAVETVELRTESDVTADKWRAVIRWNQLVYHNKNT